jgi:hypothetical protein
MARSDGPPNGSDHPPQNGHRAKQVAIALFIATTFGTMAILSFPVFRAGGPVQQRRALPGGNTPSGPLRPILPSIAPPSRPSQPGVGVALGPRSGGAVVSRVPLGPSGPGGGPGPGAPPPGEPPPGTPPPAPPTTFASTLLLRTTLLDLATTLSHRTTELSPAEVRTVRAVIALPKDLRKACMADRGCARSLKMVKRLLHRLASGKGGHKHGHRGHHGPKSATSSGSEGVLPERNHRHGHHSEGEDPNRGSGDRNGSRRHGHSGSHGKFKHK